MKFIELIVSFLFLTRIIISIKDNAFFECVDNFIGYSNNSLVRVHYDLGCSSRIS